MSFNRSIQHVSDTPGIYHQRIIKLRVWEGVGEAKREGGEAGGRKKITTMLHRPMTKLTAQSVLKTKRLL